MRNALLPNFEGLIFNTMEQSIEIWKDVVGYEGYYQISSFGKVKRVSRIGCFGNLIKEHPIAVYEGERYMLVTLNKLGKKRPNLLHRVIAQAFIPNPDNLPEVNHKDGNRLNNSIENLEWCTSSENQLHAYKIGLQINPWIGKKGIKHPCSKPVVKLSIDGKEIERFDSVRDAARSVKADESYLSHCCRNKNRKAGGFKWKYASIS